MGNFEKLIVLTVLFLAAIILGVSLHDGGAERGGGPLGPGAGLEPGASEALANLDTPARSDEAGAALSSLVKPEVKQPAAEPKVAPKREPKVEPKLPQVKNSLFRTTKGLTKPEFGDDYLLYTWRKGDTQASVANLYYGDSRLRYLIRNNNEGAAYLPGDLINLPFWDIAAEAGKRPAFEPAPAHPAPVVVETPAKPVQTYTVQDGDSLWSIAKDAYGKGTKWEQIFKANRDQLDDAADLKPGMVLLIP